jgi:hypothetical protein
MPFYLYYIVSWMSISKNLLMSIDFIFYILPICLLFVLFTEEGRKISIGGFSFYLPVKCAVENVLPAVYNEVGETFSTGPSDLGYLPCTRNFVQGRLSSPLTSCTLYFLILSILFNALLLCLIDGF